MDYTKIANTPKKWLVTGVAGFIGSHILQELLSLGQDVVGLDNFSTGSQSNLDDVRGNVTSGQWGNFTMYEGDITDFGDCQRCVACVDYVLHQAALGSVPRSIDNPIATNEANLTGFLNMLWAAKETEVKRFVYASSSAVYGDSPTLPKREDQTGQCLSPYAITKAVNETYCNNFFDLYGLSSVGLRYFNVFGPRQDPEGAYAAVIPKWFAAMIGNQDVLINGDGETSRDFCYVKNVVKANILSAINSQASATVLNVAVGMRTSLNELQNLIRESLETRGFSYDRPPVYKDFRKGDVRHSLANISKAETCIGYVPDFTIADGMKETAAWYSNRLQNIVSVSKL